MYVLPEHHDILRRIAYEQNCNLSDVLDVVLEQADWDLVAQWSREKPLQRSTERKFSFKDVP